jgi:hypothetical protein
MFVGHLAVALASKRVEPSIPLGGAVAAAFGLDLLWPILLLLGLERVRVNPGDTEFTHLAFESYPWSHSLLMAVLWSVLVWFLARRRMSSRASVLLAGLVLSHWVLDFVTHRPDLPLWPNGPVLGAGLWYSIPATIAVEGSLLAAAVASYSRTTSPLDRTGTLAFLSLIALTTLIWVTQPWAPPPPNPTAVAIGALALWLLAPWGSWIERHRAVRNSVR